jgi:hypothetical protein
MIKNIIYAFGLTASPCFIEALLTFLNNLFVKDELIEKKFINYIEVENP